MSPKSHLPKSHSDAGRNLCVVAVYVIPTKVGIYQEMLTYVSMTLTATPVPPLNSIACHSDEGRNLSRDPETSSG